MEEGGSDEYANGSLADKKYTYKFIHMYLVLCPLSIVHVNGCGPWTLGRRDYPL